jgi:anti-anti-sigma factor
MPSIELPVNLGLRIQSSDDAVVLYCVGEITSGQTRDAFRSGVIDLLHRHKNVVDLEKVQCMDRSGLESLVGLYSSAHTARARVKFVNLTIEINDSRPPRPELRKLAG